MRKHVAEPIKNRKDILAVEQYLQKRSMRDYTIWVLGLNSGLRVSDIIGLNISDTLDKTHIRIIEKKTQKRKSFYINDKLKRVLKAYTKNRHPEEPLFLGKRGKRIDRSQVYRVIKRACSDCGLKIQASTHTMRKTFGYHHYQKYKDAIILQKIFNHSSQRITLMYIGVEQDEIDLSYKNFEL